MQNVMTVYGLMIRLAVKSLGNFTIAVIVYFVIVVGLLIIFFFVSLSKFLGVNFMILHCTKIYLAQNSW
jgi:hypothetical protein